MSNTTEIRGKQIAQARPAVNTAISLYSPAAGIVAEIQTIIVCNQSDSTVDFSIFHDDDGCVVAGLLVGRMSMVMTGGFVNTLAGLGLLAAAIVVGGATVWIGPADPLALAPAALGLAFWLFLRGRTPKITAEPQKA